VPGVSGQMATAGPADWPTAFDMWSSNRTRSSPARRPLWPGRRSASVGPLRAAGSSTG